MAQWCNQTSCQGPLSLPDNGGPATSESTQSWANKLPKFPVVDSPLSVHFSNDAKNLP